MRAQSWKSITYAAAVCLALTSSTVSQTVKDLVAFSGANNLTYPGSAPVQGRDGKFYSTINGGGNAGSIFDFTASGAHGVVYALDFTNGWNPFGMVLGTDGSLYGVTANGGSLSYGVLFKVTPGGAYTALHNFTGGTDGTGPTGTPIEASDGNFYGTTNGGCCHVSTVYKYTRPGCLLDDLHLRQRPRDQRDLHPARLRRKSLHYSRFRRSLRQWHNRGDVNLIV